MLETFDAATFDACVGQAFRIVPPGSAPVTTRLVDVAVATERPAGTRDGVRRTPFSLVFRGPAGAALPQRTYRVEHDGLGAFDLFLVPIGPDADGMRYEAVFA